MHIELYKGDKYIHCYRHNERTLQILAKVSTGVIVAQTTS